MIWLDEDVVQLQINASCDGFAGTTLVFVEHDQVRLLADLFYGFPTSTNDPRYVELGTFERAYTGGGARIELSCLDDLGHAQAGVHVQREPDEPDGIAQEATIRLPITASGVDACASSGSRPDEKN